MTLSVEYKSVSALIPYVNNSRTHSEQQVKQIAASIKEFGFTNPILVDENNGVIAGHGRLLAAEILGLENVPTITLRGLTEAQQKAYVIADNKLAINAGWDEHALKIELKRLQELDFDLTATGFDVSELAGIFDDRDFAAGTENDQGKLDELEPKWCACPHCGKEFDLREN